MNTLLPFETGKKFGNLTLLREIDPILLSGRSHRRIEAKCDCGKTCVKRLRQVVKGHTKSCGCLQPRVMSEKMSCRRTAPGQSAINAVWWQYIRNAKRRNLLFDLSKEHFIKLIFGTCTYCGDGPKNIRGGRKMYGSITYNGIDRVDNSEGYTQQNCVTACETCNMAKGTKSYSEFMAWIMKVQKHQTFKNNESI